MSKRKNPKYTQLAEFVKKKRGAQSELARMTDKTPSAIWQMIRDNRNVLVVEHPDGTVQLEERKIL